MATERSCRHCGITVEASHVVGPMSGGFTGSLGVSGRALVKIAITILADRDLDPDGAGLRIGFRP